MSALAAQVRADVRVYLRTPAALFFSALLPVIFLVLFVSIFGNDRDDETGVRVATFQVPGFIALAVVSSAFVGLVISVVRAREDGVFKRIRATPVPTWVVLAGRIAVAVLASVVVTVVLLVIGRVVYDVELPLRALPAVAVAVVVAAIAFSALGLAFTAIVSNVDAGPAMTNLVALPLYFISGVFVPTSQLPDGLKTVAGVFPVKPFNDALFTAFDPRTTGAGFDWGKLAVVAAWGVAGALIAVRAFRWVPRGEAD